MEMAMYAVREGDDEADLLYWPAQSRFYGSEFRAPTGPDRPQSLTVVPITLTGIISVDALFSTYAWGDSSLTFSFPTAAGDYTDYTTGQFRLDTFTPLTLEFREAIRQILGGGTLEGGAATFSYGSIASFTNLSFVEETGGAGTMRYGFSDGYPTAWGYQPSAATGERGDTFFNETYMGYYPTPVPGSYTWLTAIHEIGHNLGFKHAHQGGASGLVVPEPFDTLEYTVMTYRSYVGASGANYFNEQFGYPQTFMMMDIRALQHLYGADFTTHAGDTVYTWNPNTGEMSIDGVAQGAPGANRVFLTIWDGNGNDTYDFSNYDNGVFVDLSPGATSTISSVQLANLGHGNFARGNVFNALLYNDDPRSLIENAVGTAHNDVLVGNQADNVLTGGDGDDLLIGGIGADHLVGGNGFDTVSYQGSTVGVHVDMSRVALGDPAGDQGDASGDILDSIERVLGSSRADELWGNDGTDILSGQQGNDELLGRAGDDQLSGNEGLDILYGEAGDDVLSGGWDDDILDGGEGYDIADFAGLKSDYAFYWENGVLMVSGPDGKDILVNIEMLRFYDGEVDPLEVICPPFLAPGGGEEKEGGPLILPGFVEAGKADEPFDPLVLPGGLEGKAQWDGGPVVCEAEGDAIAPSDPGVFDLGTMDLTVRPWDRGVWAQPTHDDWIV